MRGIKSVQLVTLALLALVILATAAAAGGTPRIVVADYATEGLVAVGSDFSLVVHFSNVGSVCAMTTTVRVPSSTPFVTTAGALGPLDICDNATVRIPLHVDASAAAGSYPLTLTLDYNDLLTNEYSASETITLDVGGSPSLTARIAGSDPLDVYPGDTASVTIALDNDGTYEAQSINGTLTADAPLEVGWSTATMAVGTLGARESTQAKFSIKVPKDAKAADYPLLLTVHYLDQDRQPVDQTFPLSFHVKSKALFSAVDGTDVLHANDQRKVVKVTLTNTGSDAARRMKLKIQPQYPFTTDGSIRYVENLAPGQSVPVEFVVNIDKDGTAGTYGLDIVADFEDAQGNLLHDTAKLALVVSEKNLAQTALDYWYVWVVVALVIWQVIVRRKNGHKKE